MLDVQNISGTVTDMQQDYLNAWLGVPRIWRSSKLPANHVIPDGSFVSFKNWPDLETAYSNGWFYGMTLAYDATADEKATYLGKWRPDAATPTGLYLPNYTERYIKCINTSNTSWMGRKHDGGVPNIVGYTTDLLIRGGTNGCVYVWNSNPNAPFRILKGDTDSSWSVERKGLKVDASLSNSLYGSSSEIQPKTIHTPVIVYLGRYKSS